LKQLLIGFKINIKDTLKCNIKDLFIESPIYYNLKIVGILNNKFNCENENRKPTNSPKK